jgi:hypothetical protein
MRHYCTMKRDERGNFAKSVEFDTYVTAWDASLINKQTLNRVQFSSAFLQMWHKPEVQKQV